MSQTNNRLTTESPSENELSVAVYNLISTLHELGAIGDVTGVTLQRLRIQPGIPAAKVEGLLEELHEDGIVQKLTIVSELDHRHRNPCETAKSRWVREPRYRLRSRMEE